MQIKTHFHSFNYLFYVDRVVIDWCIDDDVKNIKEPLDQINLVATILSEADVTVVALLIHHLKKYNFNKVTIITDSVYENFIKKDPQIDVIFIDMWVIFSKYYITNTNDRWYFKQNKGVLLTGKLLKSNRIELLNKLYNKNLLSNNSISWTFPIDSAFNRPHLETIQKLYPKDFLDFCKKFSDILSTTGEKAESYEVVAEQFDLKEIHARTNFSIVSETLFNEPEPFITEKTYRAILEHHPFILAAPVNTLAKLKSLGFKTFEQYLPCPYYDSEKDSNQRLELIINNIVAFPQILIKHRAEIQRDVDFNYQHFLTVYDRNIKILNQIVNNQNDFDKLFTIVIQMLSLSDLEKEQVKKGQKFKLKYQIEYSNRVEMLKLISWLDHYNIIKADNWPELETKDDFYNLDKHIQNECVTKFNFNPEQEYHINLKQLLKIKTSCFQDLNNV